MKTRMTINVILFLTLLFTINLPAQNSPVEKANYNLAARFAPTKLGKMIFSVAVDPHWLKLSDRFWYEYETSDGKTFYIVDAVRKSKRPIFDNVKMAAMLTKMTKDPYDAQHLPIDKIEFVKDETAIRFEVESSQDEEKKEDDEESGKRGKQGDRGGEGGSGKKAKKKVLLFEYTLASGNLTELDESEKKKEKPRWASISPDGQTIIFSKHLNLYWMDKANYEKALEDDKDSTIVEHQLTTDGEEHYGYGGRTRGETNVDKEKNKDNRKSASVIWSPDSKKFAMMRTDNRAVKDLWVINSVAKPRPTLETYKYHLPGESESPIREMLVFDLDTKGKTKIEAEAFKDQTINILTAPDSANTRDDENRATVWLAKTPDKLYFSRTSRDMKRVDICLTDLTTGEVKVLIEERLNTYIETRPLGLINNGEELLHWSERDGWAHFYLCDANGNLKNQITSGPFHSERIQRIDEKNRVLYFTANGRENGEDPYYAHLYRVNFDGTGLQLLNPGNFNAYVSMNDSKQFFVNNYSRVNTVPKSELLDNRGTKIMDLETADLSLLMEAGYQFPEPFKAKADDGITDIYGVMYKPFDFNETRQYPIIAYVYPGPQTESVNKSFYSRRRDGTTRVNMDRTDRLAQFGFIVITLGNRGGHPARSKWYHNYGYGNLRDYGLADKKAVIEQLADRHPFINIDKVGIFGHSGGGFMSTAAMLIYPDFFKVAVSSAGNHENNIYNRRWSEKHDGVKEVEDKDGNITFEYDIDKNSELATHLKGHLLICAGDIDNNVHPANTITLANALIRANKRFDYFIFPGQRHGFGDMNEYFFWLRGDYFNKHLIGDSSQSVDIVEMNREKEFSGDKGGR